MPTEEHPTEDELLTVQLVIAPDSEHPVPIDVTSTKERGDDTLEVHLEDGGVEEFKRELGITDK